MIRLLNVKNAVIFIVTVLFVANIPEVVLSKRIGIYPYQFYIVASILLFTLALFSGTVFRVPKASAYVVSWFVLLCVVCALSLLFVKNDSIARDAFSGVGMFAMIAIAFTMCATSHDALRSCGLGVVVAVVFSMVVSYVEFLDPDFKIMVDVMFETKIKEGVVQRVAGSHGNANANAYALGFGLFIGQYFLYRPLRFTFAILVGVAVFTTASRSGLILWALVIVISAFAGVYGKGISIGRILAVCLVLTLAIMLGSGSLPALIDSLGLTQYMDPKTLERFSGGFFTQEDGSTESRLGVAAFLVGEFMDNPLLGIGLGKSGSLASEYGVASHNMALRMASELGVVGLLVYFGLALVPLLARSYFSLIFVGLYFFVNLFTNTSFDKPIFSILIPMAILYFSSTFQSQNKDRSVRKKRRRRTRRHRELV